MSSGYVISRSSFGAVLSAGSLPACAQTGQVSGRFPLVRATAEYCPLEDSAVLPSVSSIEMSKERTDAHRFS
jgi:hypothetical protein